MPRAGNFSKWATLESFFDEPLILRELEYHLNDARRHNIRTYSFEIVFDHPVGWSSTDDLRRYQDRDLEFFRPNRRSEGFRVKPLFSNLLAPQTNYVTIVFEFKKEHDGPTAVIHTIYPGRDIGELVGDVTEREGIVFFDWEHPGA